jgi:hypothetical protein
MKNYIYLSIIALFFSACIGDDIINDRVAETLKITAQASTIAVGETFQFKARFTNNIGQVEDERVIWTSSNPTILSINSDGLAIALSQGNALIKAEAALEDGNTLSEEMAVEVSMETTIIETPTGRAGKIETTSFYDLEGDFTLEEAGDKLLLNFGDNYKASSSLPGLYVYLTNNPNSVNDALEVAKVEVFQGAHFYEIPDVKLSDFDYVLYYCKPFRVKVGDGKIN